MLKALILSVALTADSLAYGQLEQLYWDCDTLFMKGDLGGQDMMSCLAVTEEFQRHFPDRETFMRYWEVNRRLQWDQRGYAWPSKDS
jgi:hypothetical protein